jgi:UDP-N-acetylglucosamine--N-acetylmuramyl-(pentapeptide) pyrophosphoryl-undecaprenol N-acetylglucosamine transferase
VVIAGGGTGGHLYPGLAVAREIVRRRPDASVSFAGTSRGLEARIVPREGFELDMIRSAGLKGKSIASRLRGLGLVPLGLADAWRILSRRRPHVVIGVGGYSAGPVVLVAAARGTATLVLEQNAVPGLTNRLLSRWVRAAAVNFESTLSFFGGKGFVAGNPVRAEFLQKVELRRSNFERESPASQAPRVLVLGGSQGAHAINLAMVPAIVELRERKIRVEVVHQTGERDVAATRAGYEGAGIPARAEAFLDPVVTEMREAAVVVCRAGATTLAELAALGCPAILVPLPATDNHQFKNAEVLSSAGAAVVIEQRHLTASTLADALASLLGNPSRLAAMSRAMRTFAKPDAASRIVDKVLELSGLAEVRTSNFELRS